MENENQKNLNFSLSSSSSSCCISHVFHKTALSNPTKIAIICSTKPHKSNKAHNFNLIHNLNPPIYDNDHCFTFSELLSAVDSLTFRLHHVVNGGDDSSLIRPTSGNDNPIKLNNERKIFGVYMMPSLEYVIVVLSILRFGGVFLPLDPSWPKERILWIISYSNVDLVIGCLNFEQKSSAHLLDNSHWVINCCKVPVLCISVDNIIEQKCGVLDLVWPCESKDSRLFSYIMYTSGSSGEPKGVCGTEEGVLNRFDWMQELFPFESNEVLLFKTSISFVDHIQEILAPMLAGCTLVVPQVNALKQDVFGLVDFLYDYSITRLTAVPSLMRALVPALESCFSKGVKCSLKLLVLSGEVFPMSLCRDLLRLLPETIILNIYGSTEVSADCTYFDCRQLPGLIRYETLCSVPIGVPISNCMVKLIEEEGKIDEGEICVTGVCLSSGYYSEGNILPLNYVQLSEGSVSANGSRSSKVYYRTGDFAKRLPSGDLVFLGRKDRTIKVNGQRVSLEEVEDMIRRHPDVADAAVVLSNEQEGHSFLGAVMVLKTRTATSEILRSMKYWLVDRLPSVMVPKEIVCTEAIPMTSTGKIDYAGLSGYFASVNSDGHIVEQEINVEHIREAFCNVLGVEEVGIDDDFFLLGGDSLFAAHVAYKLGIDMRLVYMFPTPSKLHKALVEKEGLPNVDSQTKWEILAKTRRRDSLNSFDSGTLSAVSEHRETIRTKDDEPDNFKRLKVDTNLYSNPKVVTSMNIIPCGSCSVSTELALSRCNKVMCNSNCEFSTLQPETWEVELPRNSKCSLREIWRVPMDSCVDASPLIAFVNEEILIFIGSHSHKFLCVNAREGSVQWEIKLEGRIESSAMIDGEFSQVVVGCYQGKIYFIDIKKGITNWSFQTGGEVKSQPSVDKCRHLIWCGSHDHNLYALDYKHHRCVYQFPCGGTIFGSPAIDEARHILYSGTTNGRLTALTLNASEFSKLWLLELEAPIFGSLSLTSDGNIICCLVSGDVLSVDPKGSIVWRVKTNGPIFAGPCISESLNSQAIVCSRNGNVYSFELANGNILWEYHAEDPITSSAYVDDNVKLISDPSSPAERLVCICTSSGRVQLLRVSCTNAESNDKPEHVVKKFAELELQGDIFSSPVMVGGQIFVGCRDDYLHCIVAEAYFEND